MIYIHKTNSMKNAADCILSILKNIDKKELSVMRTVIVPDRASLEAERALLAAVGGSFNIQVRTFRRLANEILPKYDYLSKQAGILALTGIIQDVKDQLVCYTKGVETVGFVTDMYDTISMMKYCRISPEQLMQPNLPRGVAGKVHDIALLYRSYCDYTANRFIDSADKLDLLCEQAKSSEFITNGYFYLYDFDNFSAQELALIEKLALFSRGVVVACCVSEKPQDKYLYLNDIYDGLVKMCKESGITPKIFDDREAYCNRFTEQIGKNLFRYGDVKALDAEDFVEIYQGATRVQEVYALACRIQKYVRSGGRFRNIYVVTSDVSKYSNAISTIFDEFDIPSFCDKQFALNDHPYARYVLDYLTLCKNNGKLNCVLPFVKNYLFCGSFDTTDIPRQDEDVFHFENYCLKYNVSYNFSRFNLGKDESYFAAADNFREKFNSLYQAVSFPNAASVADYVKLVRELIEKSSLKEKNTAYSEQQKNYDLAFEGKVTTQAQQKFEEVLFQTEVISGNRFVKLDEFIKLLTISVSSVKISVIPVSNDCVVFANMAKARKHDIKFLALLGANYGAMPIVKGDTKLLTDRNIQDLTSAGINIEPQIFTENKRERFSLFQLLQEPTDKLYVSYAATDGVEALIPSPFVAELGRLFTKNGLPLCATEKSDEEVYTKKQALSKVILNTRKLADSQPVKMPAYALLKEEFNDEAEKFKYDKTREVRVENGKELYLNKSQISVTRLTDFYKCPYKFFFEYGLYVRPRPVAELKAADLGNILHDVLEYFVREMDAAESDEMTVKNAKKLFSNAISSDYYKGMSTDSRLRGTLLMLEREAVRMCLEVKKQLASTKFVNRATELEFGGSSALPPVEVDYGGGKFLLIGKIDRVDVDGKNFIVIDYKSGADAAHYKEEYLYVGHKLQLLVYVKAVQEAFEGYRPVGFYYFNLHDNFTDENQKTVYTYNGRTLDDMSVAERLDTNLAENGVSGRLGLKKCVNGDFNRQGNKLLTEDQMANQVEYSLKMIEQAGKLMQQGFSDISPYEGVCEYCDFKCVCDYKETLVYNPRKADGKIDKNTIDKAVEKCKNSQKINKE